MNICTFFNENKFYLIFWIMVIFVLSCANPRPPSGGPPDKTPPKVIEFTPQNFSINFSGKEISIKFNKWVDRNSVVNNIFLNPPIKYEIVWSGKKMNLRFAENLPENTTFSFLLGTNYNDLDGNKPTEPFSLVFSTGSIIDSGKISGRVISDIPQNIFIYAFPFNELETHNFDPNKSFHYRTQPDNSGFFRFDALRTDTFLVFAYTDKNNNKEFEFGLENFGLCSSPIPINLNLLDTCTIILNPLVDESPPILVDAIAPINYLVKLTFSEPIMVKQGLTKNIIEIVDTSSQKSYNPYFTFTNIANPKELLAFFKDTLPESVFQVIIKDSSLICDTVGNILEVEKPLLFRLSKFREKPQLTILEKQIQIPTPKNKAIINISLPLDTFRSNLTVKSINIEQGDTVEVQYSFEDLNVISISISNMKWRSLFAIDIKADSIFDYLGNKYMNFHHTATLRVDDEPNYGSIQGLLLASLDSTLGTPMLMAFSPKGKYYSKIIGNRWKFEQIPEGEYVLIAFYDGNGNGIYDGGKLKPFQFSEKIIKVSPKISVRKGWSVEEIRF